MNGILRLHSVLIHCPDTTMAPHLSTTDDSEFPIAQYRNVENPPSDHCEEIRPIHASPEKLVKTASKLSSVLFMTARSV